MRLAKFALVMFPAVSLTLPAALVAGQPFGTFEQPCQKTRAKKQKTLAKKQSPNSDLQLARFNANQPFGEPSPQFTEMVAVPAGRADTRRPAGAGSYEQVMQVVQLMNAERQKAGLRPLTVNANLQRAAGSYAGVLARANKLSHTYGGTEPGSRARAAGYRTKMVAENIAMGYPNARSAVSGWMKSTGHRRNILNPKYRDVGIGVQAGNKGQLYWVAKFGTQ